MKSISVKSGYQMVVYGNNLGVGHPLTQIGGNWITSFASNLFEVAQKYNARGYTDT